MTEEQLTVAFAVAVSRRERQLGARVRRGTPEAAAFGMLTAGLRAGLGLDRTGLAARARLDPVQLVMLEQGLLGHDEIPAILVARIAAGLGRRLAELPLTPYEVGSEPGDDAEVGDGETRLSLGLATLEPWVAALVEPGPAPPPVWLPEFALQAAGSRWLVREAQLTTSPVPVRRSDDYSWHVLLGRERPAGERWSLFARLTGADGGVPAAGVEVALRMGAQCQVAVSGARGAIGFAGLDVADLDPLRFEVSLRRIPPYATRDMQDSWRQLFLRDERVQLRHGCSLDDLASAERLLGHALPADLRDLLLETDGVYHSGGQWYAGWPLDRIVRENTHFGRDGRLELGPGLVAFGDDGTGNPFCLLVPGGGADPRVFHWNWIDGEATEKAGSLREFWQRWMRGEIRT